MDVKQVLKEHLSPVGNGIMREFHYIVDFLNWILCYASYIYFIIRVPGGGQISKELAKWNPTLVPPSFAKDTGASNKNPKLGMFQWKHYRCSKSGGHPHAGNASAPWSITLNFLTAGWKRNLGWIN